MIRVQWFCIQGVLRGLSLRLEIQFDVRTIWYCGVAIVRSLKSAKPRVAVLPSFDVLTDAAAAAADAE